MLMRFARTFVREFCAVTKPDKIVVVIAALAVAAVNVWKLLNGKTGGMSI